MTKRRISGLRREAAIAGQIRGGWSEETPKKSGKGTYNAPKRDGNLVFTSSDPEQLEQIQDLDDIPGPIEEWHRRKGFWIYKSKLPKLRVWLPFQQPHPDSEDPIGDRMDSVMDGPLFKDWDQSQGQFARICDGVDMLVPSDGGPDGPSRVEAPCYCEQFRPEGEGSASEVDPFEKWRKCKLKLKLKLVLPDVSFSGIWTYETGSKNACMEIPAFVEHLAGSQPDSASLAAVSMIMRPQTSKGGSNEFFVAQLVSDHTPVELASGTAGSRELGSGVSDSPALTAGVDVVLAGAADVAALLVRVQGMDDAGKEAFRCQQDAEECDGYSWSFKPDHVWTLEELEECTAWIESYRPTVDDEIVEAELVE